MKTEKCWVKDCKEKVEYVIPNFLCAHHWQMWFDLKIKIKSRFTGRVQ